MSVLIGNNTSKNNYFDYLKYIRVNNSFYLRPDICEEVCDIIQFLDVNKSLGPNSLPVHSLKICNNFFSTCLLQITNLSFSTGNVPNLYKVAKVNPIFKKDDPSLLCQNYRPILLLPIYSKLFEKYIFDRMYNFIAKPLYIPCLD